MTPAIRVLLVEDNRIEARQTQRWLGIDNDGAFEIDAVDQLQLGVELLARVDFDIVLLDLNLPDVDGLTVLTRIRDVDRGCRVVILTAYGTPDMVAEATKRGADLVLNKPFDVDDITRVVRRTLNLPAA